MTGWGDPGPPAPPVPPSQARWSVLIVVSLLAALLLGTAALGAAVVAVASSPPCGAFAHTGSCTEEESADIEDDFQLAVLATGLLGALTVVAGVVFVVAVVRVVRAGRAEARARGRAP